MGNKALRTYLHTRDQEIWLHRFDYIHSWWRNWSGLRMVTFQLPWHGDSYVQYNNFMNHFFRELNLNGEDDHLQVWLTLKKLLRNCDIDNGIVVDFFVCLNKHDGTKIHKRRKTQLLIFFLINIYQYKNKFAYRMLRTHKFFPSWPSLGNMWFHKNR